MKKLIFSLLAAAMFAGCISEKPVDKGSAHLPLGTPMPEFTVTGANGTLSNGDLAGQKTLVVLFRSTCPDCRRELPKVEAAYKALGGETSEVRFVAISKEAPQAVDEYWREAGYTIPYYISSDGEAFPAFGVEYVPTLYLFGTDGKAAFAAVETFDFDADGLVNQIRELQ